MCGQCENITIYKDDPPFMRAECGQHWVQRDGAWKAVIASTYIGVQTRWEKEQSDKREAEAAAAALKMADMYGETLNGYATATNTRMALGVRPWDEAWDPKVHYWRVEHYDRDEIRFWWYDSTGTPQVGDASGLLLATNGYNERVKSHTVSRAMPDRQFSEAMALREQRKQIAEYGKFLRLNGGQYGAFQKLEISEIDYRDYREPPRSGMDIGELLKYYSS